MLFLVKSERLYFSRIFGRTIFSTIAQSRSFHQRKLSPLWDLTLNIQSLSEITATSNVHPQRSYTSQFSFSEFEKPYEIAAAIGS